MLSYDSLIERINNIQGIQKVITGKLKTGHPVYMISYGNGDKSVVLSAGIHGDEPAGVEAILRFLEGGWGGFGKGIKGWEKGYRFTIFPCTNPTGYEWGKRENIVGIDLNRKFGTENPPEEILIIQSTLEGRRFDLYIDLHEDIEGEGFYLYEVLGKGCNNLAGEIIKEISRKYPVDPRERIDGFPNCGGVICPQKEGKRFHLKRNNLPLPLYLYLHGTRHCFTFESPAKFPVEERVEMHLMAIEKVLSCYTVL